MRKLAEPRHKLKTHLELEGGKRVELPFPERARILPNARAVVVILDENLEVDGVQVQRPNNAAVFDSNGKLAAILENPEGPATCFHGFEGSNSDALRGEGDVWISVRPEEAEAYWMHSYRIDSGQCAIERSSRRRMPV